MMTRQSFVPRLLVLELAAVFLLLSCASTRPPQRLRVRVAPGFGGTLQLTPCAGRAGGPEISADANGHREYTAAPEDISIRRTGDGIPTSIAVRMHP
jgi:hypothetical protein